MKTGPYIIDTKGHRVMSDEFVKATLSGPFSYPLPDLAPSTIPDVEWEPPEVIDQETVITGRNFRNESGADQAIGINGAKVTFRDCKFMSNSNTSIQGWGGSSITVENCEFYADPVPNQQYAKINIWGAKSFVFQHNTMNHTGGLLVEQWQGAPDAPLLVRYNKSLNVDKRRGDGSVVDHRAFIQLSTIRGLSACEIAWNESINEPGKSFIEDNINIFNTRGASIDKPILIHNNFISGAFPFDLVTHFTGSGITVDGTPDVVSADMMSAFIKAYGNIVIRCANACMNIAAGHDVSYTDNDMISSGMFSDGTKSNLFWGACCAWDASRAGANFTRNTIKGNRIGYARPDQNVPLPGRNDYVTVDNDVRILPTDNTHLPNPITLETEKTMEVKWAKKLADNQITLGPGENGTIPTSAPSVTLKVGQKGTGKIAPVNAKGEPVAYKPADLTATSKDASIFTVTNDLIVTPVKAGEATGTVMLTTTGGKAITKTFTVKVLASDTDLPTIDNEATDFTLTFIIS